VEVGTGPVALLALHASFQVAVVLAVVDGVGHQGAHSVQGVVAFDADVAEHVVLHVQAQGKSPGGTHAFFLGGVVEKVLVAEKTAILSSVEDTLGIDASLARVSY
jgi:hypothetical protein